MSNSKFIKIVFVAFYAKTTHLLNHIIKFWTSNFGTFYANKSGTGCKKSF